MITTELKDKVLKEIVENAPELFAGFDIHDMGKQFQVSHRIIDALLSEYEAKGFMEVSRMLGGVIHCDLTIRSHDFVRGGGYKFEETLATSNLEKLTLEIESLYNKIPDEKYSRMMTFLSTITAVLGLAKGN